MNKRPPPDDIWGEVPLASASGNKLLKREEEAGEDTDSRGLPRRTRAPPQRAPLGGPPGGGGLAQGQPQGQQGPEVYYEGRTATFLTRALQERGEGATVEVAIRPESLSSNNRQVRARHLWGDEVYTQDSDLVAALMHGGWYSHALTAPPHNTEEVRVVVAALPPQASYPSRMRNTIKSRGWVGAPEGCSYKVLRCCLISRAGAWFDLQPSPDDGAVVMPTFLPGGIGAAGAEGAAGAAPGAAGWGGAAAAAAAAATQTRGRPVQEVTLLYNFGNEPRLKYTLASVADKGLAPAQWTSARLLTQVMFLETTTERYELSRVWPRHGGAPAGGPAGGAPGASASAAAREGREKGEARGAAERAGLSAAPAGEGNVYRWARCRERALLLPELRRLGLPLPDPHVEVLAPALAWEDLQWGTGGVHCQGKKYEIVRVHFAPRVQPGRPAP